MIVSTFKRIPFLACKSKFFLPTLLFAAFCLPFSVHGQTYQVNPGAIGNAQTLCVNGDPAALTNVTPASSSPIATASVLVDKPLNLPATNWGYTSTSGDQQIAEDFTLASAATATVVTFSGWFTTNATTASFEILFFTDAGEVPATTAFSSFNTGPITGVFQGLDSDLGGGNIYQWTVTIPPVTFTLPGKYWISIRDAEPAADFRWESATPNGDRKLVYRLSNTADWTATDPGFADTDAQAVRIEGTLNSSGPIDYQWQSNTAGCDATFANIPGATGPTFDPGPLNVTTYYRRVAKSTYNGTEYVANSNCVAVTVNGINAGSIGNPQTVCVGGDPAVLTNASAGTGSGGVTYQWQSNTAGCDAPFTNIGGATAPTFDPGVLNATTYFRRAALSTLNGVPCGATSNCVQISIVNCGPPQGCGPGTWKHNVEAWPSPYSASQTLESVFNVPDAYGLDNVTLRNAIDGGGGSGAVGGAKILFRAAVSALLNAQHAGVNYPRTTTSIINDVNAALATGNKNTMVQLASALEVDNSLGCPLNNLDQASGTSSASIAQDNVAIGKISAAASPNPFSDRVKFTVNAFVSGPACLEVYNFVGQKLGTVFKGYVTAGRTQVIDYQVPAALKQNLLYVFSVNDQRVTGRLINVGGK